jgi:tetratricopeptide (TPR) repeat protein
MLIKLNAHALSVNILRHSAFQSVLLLLTLSIWAGTITSQSEQERNFAAERLFNEGMQLYKEGSKVSLEEAIRKYEEARPLYNSLKNTLKEATTLNNLSTLHGRLGRVQKAIDYYLQALSLRRNIGDRQGEANTLRNLGGFYLNLDEKQKALDYLTQSIPLFRALGESRDAANLLTQIGGVHHDLGEKQKALDYILQALPLYRTLGN